jgi:hypothetical protein
MHFCLFVIAILLLCQGSGISSCDMSREESFRLIKRRRDSVVREFLIPVWPYNMHDVLSNTYGGGDPCQLTPDNCARSLHIC